MSGTRRKMVEDGKGPLRMPVATRKERVTMRENGAVDYIIKTQLRTTHFVASATLALSSASYSDCPQCTVPLPCLALVSASPPCSAYKTLTSTPCHMFSCILFNTTPKVSLEFTMTSRFVPSYKPAGNVSYSLQPKLGICIRLHYSTEHHQPHTPTMPTSNPISPILDKV